MIPGVYTLLYAYAFFHDIVPNTQCTVSNTLFIKNFLCSSHLLRFGYLAVNGVNLVYKMKLTPYDI